MLSHASYGFNNWHSTLWHVSLSGRIDSTYDKGNEVQVFCDIINLYSSVPINKALDVLIDQLNNDKDDLMKRTKLCLKDIYVN